MNAADRQKIDRLKRAIRTNVLKLAGPCRCRQDAVANVGPPLSLAKRFVGKEKERFVLSVPMLGHTLAKINKVHRAANVKTVIVLPQYRFWRDLHACRVCTIEVVEERVGVIGII